jgi:polar amino acid transport system substrate-binding protein
MHLLKIKGKPMQHLFRIGSLFLVLWIILQTAQAECLKVITEEHAPFNYIEDGKVTGFSVKIVEHLISATGVCLDRGKILYWPWQRAYLAALSEPNVMIFTTTRSPARESLFKWVGPIYQREQRLYKLKIRKDIHIASLADAIKYQAVATKKSANYDFLVKNGFSPGVNLISANYTDSKFNMFLSGRGDIAFFLPIEIRFLLRQKGIPTQDVEKLNIKQGDLYYYLAFSKKTPDAIIVRFQQALDAMKADGQYKMILNEYMK